VDTDEIGAVLQRVAADTRHSCTIGCVSSHTVKDGAFRRVRAIVIPPGDARLTVRTRDGCLAGLPRPE
jgi:hypothetical protein